MRQVFPLHAETQASAGYSIDPLLESNFTRCNGLLHKYPGRVLLVTTGACAIHCRYCFRRHFPYAEVPHSIKQWIPAIDAIAEDSSIEEVLLSGGDPLMLVDDILQSLIEQIASIPHLQRLRIHTRLPVVVPSRVTDRLIAMLKQTRLTCFVVLHINHVNEIDDSVAAASANLIDHGIPVLNQAVLLRDVNDSFDALSSLFRRLINLRIIPYYLHQLDHVAGAAHFAVDEARGRELIGQLQDALPGYAVPRYVVEQPNQKCKTVLR
ncbi:MAG: KamA family radical SAM protein [Pirellulaceae bacterium]